MNFSRLPDNVLVKIFEYLPLEECIRSGRVDKTFRRISQLTTSHTKSLDLTEDRFEDLDDDQLAIILDLCSPNLKHVKFPSTTIRDNRVRELTRIFAFYHCIRLIDIDLGYAAIDPATFSRLIRNNPNLESLIWRGYLVGFPNITNENLKKLTLNCSNDTSVQLIIGHCPNLEELELTLSKPVSANVLDQVFASIPQVHLVDLDMDDMVGDMRLEKELVNLWNLPLTSLKIEFLDILNEDNILYKVASSFPHLQSFHISLIVATRDGIAALADLQELEFLHLAIDCNEQEDDYQDGLRQLTRCKKLRKLELLTLSIRAGILITLLRGCPQLDGIDIWEIDEVDNPNKAVELLEGLLGISNRDITIKFHSGELVSLKSIWESESVNEMIKTLEENYGLQIRFGWRDKVGLQHEMEDDSSDFSNGSADSSD